MPELTLPTPQPALSMGLAKSAPIPVVQPPSVESTAVAEPPKPQASLSTPSWEGVPIDTIRYLGKDIGSMNTKDIEQLKDIDRWSKQGLTEDTIGHRLEKLRSLEQTLGAPGLHETRVDKVWNWIKIQFTMDEMRMRQKAFER